jgi:hypothetical protein
MAEAGVESTRYTLLVTQVVVVGVALVEVAPLAEVGVTKATVEVLEQLEPMTVELAGVEWALLVGMELPTV